MASPRSHFPAQPEGTIGSCVSMYTQNGTDQTKSAEVAIWLRPGIPSKIGGWAE
jgi:hypothetical protein